MELNGSNDKFRGARFKFWDLLIEGFQEPLYDEFSCAVLSEIV